MRNPGAPVRQRKLPQAIVGPGGGVGPKPPPKPPYIEPPFMSFDPSIEAERRAAQRGLGDTLSDIKTKEHFGKVDLREALGKINLGQTRGVQDITRTATRGLRKLGYQEQALDTRGARANEDFNTQLSNIGRQFAQLGQRQGEAQNAAGVQDQGTQAAAGVARAGNQQLAEAPLDVAHNRENEDIATSLGQLGTARGEVGADETRGLNRLGQDTKREQRLTHQETARKLFEGSREGQRARREASINNINELEKEIYAAREEHPSVFRNWKQANPNVFSNLGAPKKKKGGR